MTVPPPTAIVADPDAEPFRAGLRDGELRLPRCRDCGTLQFPPRLCCLAAGCGGALAWEPVSPRGTVYAVTVCHRTPAPWLEGAVPFTVALVDLDAGARLIGRVVETGTDAVGPGDAVDALADPAAADRGIAVVAFRPVRAIGRRDGQNDATGAGRG